MGLKSLKKGANKFFGKLESGATKLGNKVADELTNEKQWKSVGKEVGQTIEKIGTITEQAAPIAGIATLAATGNPAAAAGVTQGIKGGGKALQGTGGMVRLGAESNQNFGKYSGQLNKMNDGAIAFAKS